jgi:hypothetical protein
VKPARSVGQPVVSPRTSFRSKEKYQMSRLYGPMHRSLQDRFDTRRLSDNIEARVVLTEIPPDHKAFIETSFTGAHTVSLAPA